jgi:hypothetical protein
MEANPKIDNFIRDLLFTDRDKGEIVTTLRKLVTAVSSNIAEEIKYGGLVFMSDQRLFCGIFIRKNHVSVEFDRGTEMQDPDNFLEGSGANRRHLKIFHEDDIKNKKAGYYIKQSFTL